MVIQLVKNFKTYMRPEGWLPCSQDHAHIKYHPSTCTYVAHVIISSVCVCVYIILSTHECPSHPLTFDHPKWHLVMRANYEALCATLLILLSLVFCQIQVKTGNKINVSYIKASLKSDLTVATLYSELFNQALFQMANYSFYVDTHTECIQKFPDWLDNEINNHKHSLRCNTKSYGSKTH
jgi:hypothetical protein